MGCCVLQSLEQHYQLEGVSLVKVDIHQVKTGEGTEEEGKGWDGEGGGEGMGRGRRRGRDGKGKEEGKGWERFREEK